MVILPTKVDSSVKVTPIQSSITPQISDATNVNPITPVMFVPMAMPLKPKMPLRNKNMSQTQHFEEKQFKEERQTAKTPVVERPKVNITPLNIT